MWNEGSDIASRLADRASSSTSPRTMVEKMRESKMCFKIGDMMLEYERVR
jgi:hypothetical protein